MYGESCYGVCSVGVMATSHGKLSEKALLITLYRMRDHWDDCLYL